MEPTAIDEPLSLPILACIALAIFLSNVVYGVTGFGNIILVHVFWQIIFLFVGSDHADNLVEVVSLGSLLSLISVVPVYWVTRNQIKWNFVLWIAPPELAFTVVGGMVLFLTPSDTAKKILGGIFLLFAIWRAMSEIKSVPSLQSKAWMQRGSFVRKVLDTIFPDPPTQANSEEPVGGAGFCDHMTLMEKLGGAFAGALAGFMRGMFATPGPPLMVYYSLINIKKEHIRSVNNAIAIFGAPLGAAYLLWWKGGWRWSQWPSYVVVLVFGVIGLGVGNVLFKYLPSQLVMRIVLGLLALAAVALIGPPLWFTFAFIILETLVLVGVIAWVIFSKREKASEPEEMEVPLTVASEEQEAGQDDYTDPEASLLAKAKEEGSNV